MYPGAVNKEALAVLTSRAVVLCEISPPGLRLGQDPLCQGCHHPGAGSLAEGLRAGGWLTRG